MKSAATSIGRATLLIVISAVSFGSISVLTVLITATGVPLLTAMAWRYVVAAILLTGLIRHSKFSTVPRRRVAQLLLIGGFGQTVITYMSLYALNYIPVGPLAFLFYTYPAWVALLAAIRKTERLTPVRVLALMLALTGVTVMVGSPMAERLDPLGVGLALGSALIYSAYLPALEHLQRGIDALPSTLLIIAGAAVSFTLIAFFVGQMFLPTRLDAWTNILLLAIVSTVIAFSALIKGLSILGPVRTSIVATVEPFFTAVLGVIVLRNQLGATTIIGGILIAAAILLIEWSSARLQLASS